MYNPFTLEWLKLYGTGGANGQAQNVWTSVDGRPKSISVTTTQTMKKTACSPPTWSSSWTTRAVWAKRPTPSPATS